jgi:hypothetical protein
MRRSFSFFAAIFSCILSENGLTATADFSNLLAGVSRIVSPGTPGPVYPTETAWVPIVGGDDDASFPATFAMARTHGLGRVVAMGHDNVIQHLELLDNRTFTLNVVGWLDVSDRKRVSCASGHGEWVNDSNLGGLKSELNARGYGFEVAAYPLNSTSLQEVSVLIVGDAWQDFSENEIEAVRAYVVSGGGLLLIGTGWSWEPYHPGTTIEDYPMMKLARPYGLRWLKSSVSDPTDQLDGSPIFRVFYPNVEPVSLAAAFGVLDQVHAQHPLDLPIFLETNAVERVRYVHAHQTLQVVTQEMPDGDPQRVAIYDFIKKTATIYPNYFRKSPAFDYRAFPQMARVRERVFRTWIDTLRLDAGINAEIAFLTGLSGRYLDIWKTFGVWVLDNNSLDAAQLDFLHNCLSLIPASLHDLRAISVNDFLGNASTPMPLAGLAHDVNIFGVRMNQWPENSFPDDVSPSIIPIFCGAAVHEINHVVDVYTVGWSSTSVLANRRKNLIDAAGTNHMNYLRSMIPDGFFKNAPQEFFASLANEWFTDSEKTLQLGLLRFDRGLINPINQALFFADVFSLGGSSTWFYRLDQNGNLLRETVPLRRDTNGHIQGMRLGGMEYSFSLKPNGDVTSWKAAPSLTISLITSEAVVSYPSQATNYMLQFRADFSATSSWASVLNVESASGQILTLTNPATGPSGFYRLYRPY